MRYIKLKEDFNERPKPKFGIGSLVVFKADKSESPTLYRVDRDPTYTGNYKFPVTLNIYYDLNGMNGEIFGPDYNFYGRPEMYSLRNKKSFIVKLFVKKKNKKNKKSMFLFFLCRMVFILGEW